MKHLLVVLFSTSLFLASCSPTTKNEAISTSDSTFNKMLKQFNEEQLKLSPIEATLQGDDRYNDLLPNIFSQAYRNQVKEFYSKYSNELKAFDPNTVSENDQISYDVLQWECDTKLEGLKFKDYLIPFNQIFSIHLYAGQLASGKSFQPFKTVKDYDNWLSRVHAYVILCDTALVNMKQGIKEGYVLPKILINKVIPQFASFDHGPVEDHLFYMPIKNIPPEFSQEEKSRLTKAYQDMILNEIIPLNKKIKDFLQNEYMNAGRESSGIDGIPTGKEFYKTQIKFFTTTTKTADEIFVLGKSEVDRISKEMEAVKSQVGFHGGLKEFFVHLRTKKELMPFSQPEEVIANFNAIHEKMKPHLKMIFDKTPKATFEVRRTEAFRENSASAEYNPGSRDGKRGGVFYVPIPDAKAYNILSDEDLFLHEAIPGHHYQVSLQMENTTLPDFRRSSFYGAYVEGWALYTESLGKELGLYTDPYQYFGMLNGEMHRAIRLVVDAGLHSQGWTREQAIQYSKDHEAETEDSIVAEIERYMVGPGQALSYKIGQLKILELRAKAEKELGTQFRLAEFHNQILDSGGLPLQVLEKKIDRWIDREKEK